MLRLSTVLPEWTRVMWTTPAARKKWEGIIQNVVQAWIRLERWTVVDGARGSCLTFCEAHQLPELVRWATGHGVVALPLAQVGISQQYSAAPTPIIAGRPWQYRVVLCRPEYCEPWLAAWDGGETNNDVIGELLGFPECCRRFFDRVWVDEKFLDTTWPMAVNSQDTDELVDSSHMIEIPELPIEPNILLRWLGVRAVAHLPCSFECAATVDVATMFREVADAREFGEWMDYAAEILSWPVEWSALHGIAEIKTPILKISSRTDMTAKKYVVQKLGSSYPAEGASGISFPYQNRQRVQLTKTPAFARAFEPDPPALKSEVEIVTLDTWTDNGFSTLEAMNDAHDVLLDATPFAELKSGAEVLDLGCGNARLLERLGDLVPELDLYGIEVDPDRCRRAGARCNGGALSVYEGSMFDPEMWTDLRPALVYFMPGRLLESGAEWTTFRGLLRVCERAVFYAYGDWLAKGAALGLVGETALRALIEAAGLENDGWEIVAPVVCSKNAEAVLARRR